MAGREEEWQAALAPLHGTKVVADHNLWPYFAGRYGIVLAGYLEPKPGVSPTTRHLGEIVQVIRRDQIGQIWTSPYFDPRHAAFVSAQTGARVVELAHQVGARPGLASYEQLIEYNVAQVRAAGH